MNSHSPASALLNRFKELRESAGISESELERKLILGPGWIRKIETGEVVPRISTLLALLNSIGSDLQTLIKDIDISHDIEIDRQITSEERKEGFLIRFPYGKFNAEYLLPDATQKQLFYILSACHKTGNVLNSLAIVWFLVAKILRMW